MPRGFDDIASGASLSVKLQGVAQSFLDGLQKLSKDGRVTAEHPMTGSEIRRKFAAIGVKLSSDEIRALVNYHRRRGERIISTSKGYFMTDKYEEAEEWIRSFKDRINASIEAYNGLLSGFGITKGQFSLLK